MIPMWLSKSINMTFILFMLVVSIIFTSEDLWSLNETGMITEPFWTHRGPGADFVAVSTFTRIHQERVNYNPNVDHPPISQTLIFSILVPDIPQDARVVATFVTWSYTVDGIPPTQDQITINGVETPIGGVRGYGIGEPSLSEDKHRSVSYVWEDHQDLVNIGQNNTIVNATDKQLGIDDDAWGHGLSIIVVYDFAFSPEIMGDRIVYLYEGFTSTESNQFSEARVGLINNGIDGLRRYSGGDCHLFLNAQDGQDEILGELVEDNVFIGSGFSTDIFDFLGCDWQANAVDVPHNNNTLPGLGEPDNAWRGLKGLSPANNLYDHIDEDVSAYLINFNIIPPIIMVAIKTSNPDVCEKRDRIGHSFAALSYRVRGTGPIDAVNSWYCAPIHIDPQSIIDTSFTLVNWSDEPLDYTVNINYFSGTGWLSMDDPSGGSNQIPTGSDSSYLFTITATAPSEQGVYQAEIVFNYDDGTKGSAEVVIPFDLYNFWDSYPPEDKLIRTSNNRLAVSQVRIGHGIHGSQASYFNDPEAPINYLLDGSLIISTGVNNNNYMIHFDSDYCYPPANELFIPLSRTIYDSLSYSSYRYASGKACTADSTIAYDVRYYAPKHPDSSDFYIMHFDVYAGPCWDSPIDTVHLAYAADFDLLCDYGPANNYSGFNLSPIFIYQQGANFGSPTGNDNRFAALSYFGEYEGGLGVSYPGGIVLDNPTWVRPNANYPQDSLYTILSTHSGLSMYSGDPVNLNTILLIAQNQTIGASDTLSFIVIIALSNNGSVSDIGDAIVKAEQFSLDHVVNPAVCDCILGDTDGSGAVDISDAVYLIAFIFGGGPAPTPYPVCSGDADCNCAVDISDAVYLISYIFSGGPAPCDCEYWMSICGLPLY